MNALPKRSIESQSFTTRLAAWLAIAVIVVSAVAVATLYHVVSQAATKDIERRVDEVLAYLVGTLEMPLWEVDYDGVRAIGAAVSNDEAIVRLIVRDESGAVVYAKEKTSEDALTERSARIFHTQGNQQHVAGDVSVSLTHKAYQAGSWQLMQSSVTILVLILSSVVIVAVVSIRASLKRLLKSLDGIAARFAAETYDISDNTLPYLEFQSFGRALVQMARKIEGQIETIRVTEGKYRNIFENAIEGIFQSTVEGRFLSANPALARILRYDSVHDLVTRVGDIANDTYVDHEQRGELLSLLLDRGGVAGYEVRFRCKDGHAIWGSLSARMVRDETGRPLYIEGFLADVTERKRGQEEIRKLNQELEQRVADRTAQLESAYKELEAFAYSVSHDLRAPLRHIDGFLGLLKEKIASTLDAESDHYMVTISDAAKRMALLIDDLLSFSRMGRSEMTRTNVDLDALVREVIRDFKPETEGRAVDWHVEALPVVDGDRAMLRVVLVNLISNALKFTHQRAQTEIAIGCLPELATEAVVFVRDNGAGFDMRYVDKLFGVFQRLHGVEEFEGTGIGLANVRRVINRHGGRTWAEGKVDGGATFYFSLPQARHAESAEHGICEGNIA